MVTPVFTIENLFSAFKKASMGKRRNAEVAAFEYRLEENLIQLREDLLRKTYRPGAYESFYIHEPKRRLISAAPFRDRVVHHALCNIIEPVFERSFIKDSYANRKLKGTHRALDRCQHFSRQYGYVLQCDMKQFFPSIDHEILKRKLFDKVIDTSVQWLIKRIIDSGSGVLTEAYDMVYFKGDDLFAHSRPRGLPIGNLTSQFWSNVYLNAFDHFVKRELQCKAYLRYVDDFLLFANDKPTLWGWKSAIKKRLQTFRLTIHPHSHPRPVSEGIPFLGFVIFPYHRRLKRRKGIHYQRKLKKMVEDYHSGLIPFEQIGCSISGWVNHVRYANTVGLRKRILGNVKIRIRRDDERKRS